MFVSFSPKITTLLTLSFSSELSCRPIFEATSQTTKFGKEFSIEHTADALRLTSVFPGTIGVELVISETTSKRLEDSVQQNSVGFVYVSMRGMTYFVTSFLL